MTVIVIAAAGIMKKVWHHEHHAGVTVHGALIATTAGRSISTEFFVRHPLSEFSSIADGHLLARAAVRHPLLLIERGHRLGAGLL
jgi:hypothetical protein